MEIKRCANCANGVWTSREQQVPEVCISCHYRGDGVPSAWKPMSKTNADRIRAMSDEELTRWLLQFVIDCAEKTTGEECEFEDGSEAELQEWLKQPAEDE